MDKKLDECPQKPLKPRRILKIVKLCSHPGGRRIKNIYPDSYKKSIKVKSE